MPSESDPPRGPGLGETGDFVIKRPGRGRDTPPYAVIADLMSTGDSEVAFDPMPDMAGRDPATKSV